MTKVIFKMETKLESIHNLLGSGKHIFGEKHRLRDKGQGEIGVKVGFQTMATGWMRYWHRKGEPGTHSGEDARREEAGRTTDFKNK